MALTVVFGTWAGDTFAYFIGRFFGTTPDGAAPLAQEDLGGLRRRRHRHGARGRLHRPLLPRIGASQSLLLGLVIAVVAPLGDLFESLLKRDVEVKDAGRFFPGTAACWIASTACSSLPWRAYWLIVTLF